MPVLFGKLHDFVFDRWAIARTNSFDLPAVEGRAFQVLANAGVNFWVSVAKIARNLRKGYFRCGEAESAGRAVALLRLHLSEIDTLADEPRGRPRFQSQDRQAQVPQMVGESE